MAKTITLEEICGPARKGVSKGLKRGGTVKQPGQVSAATRHAKDLFLRGNGDGKPVTNVLRLKELSGVSTATIEKWLPLWERERREIATRETKGKGKLGDAVTGDVIQWQSEKVSLLKSEIDLLAVTIKTLPVGSDIRRDTVKHYKDLLKAWEESSGFADYAATQHAYSKELARTAARAQGKPDAERKVIGQTFDFNIDGATKLENGEV